MIGDTVTAVPDTAEPLIGFRGWNLEEDQLLPPYQNTDAWKPGQNTAVCTSSVAKINYDFLFDYHEILEHQAPDPACMCGLYAYHTLSDMQYTSSDQIIGAVKLWGAVEVHETGSRAEHAEVVALAKPSIRVLWILDLLFLLANTFLLITDTELTTKIFNGSVALLLAIGFIKYTLPAWKDCLQIRRSALQAANHYGVPLVPYRKLSQEALKHGTMWKPEPAWWKPGQIKRRLLSA